MTDIETRLAELATLQPNWDSYGAVPPTAKALDVARRTLLALQSPGQIVPTLRGGVQIEWHEYGISLEIEIGPDGAGKNWCLWDQEGREWSQSLRS